MHDSGRLRRGVKALFRGKEGIDSGAESSGVYTAPESIPTLLHGGAMRTDPEFYVKAAHELYALDIEPLPPEAGYFGFKVRDLADGWEVWVVRMLVNWRVLETLPDSWGYGRFWCYPGTGLHSFLAAVINAALYGDGEPDGWIKAWDGRRGQRLEYA